MIFLGSIIDGEYIYIYIYIYTKMIVEGNDK